MDIFDFHPNKVIPEPNSGCWLWAASCFADGYGAVRFQGKTSRAHRASYMISCGEIEQGAVVLHKCDNPICVNPDHLRIGTHADNVADRVAKGRTVAGKGERQRSAVLTEFDVLSIRRKHNIDGVEQKRLALEYGVNTGTISRVCTGKSWKHI